MQAADLTRLWGGNALEKTDVRIFFEKKGRAVYISHLDLLRTMQRALKRSGLPVWYTEGFNPRIYLNFPLALSLGTQGEREPMDVCITEDISMEELTARLDAAMPEGLRIISAAAPVFHNKDIGFAEYTAVYRGSMEDISGAINDFMAQDAVEVQKHSKKKGMITVDIKPHITVKAVYEGSEGICVDFRLPAGNELNLNAALFTDAFAEFSGKREIICELLCTKRTNIFCRTGEVFA